MPDIFVSEPKVKPQENTLPEVSKQALSVVSIKNICPPQKNFNRNTLSAFRYCPTNIKFLNQDTEERIVLLLRRHLFTNIRWVIIVILMLFAPFFLRFFPILDFLPGNYQFIAVVFWYLITVAYFLESFLAWYFNVSMVTNERVIDVNFSNLVYREISEADLTQIQDFTVQMGSPIRTVFNFGEVLIQTASETKNLHFEAVPNPDRVAKILRDLREEEEKVHS